MRRLILLGFLASLAGCASLPAVDSDLMAESHTANGAGIIELMRIQEERLTRRPFVGGNAVLLLDDGPSTYAAMQQAIAGAKQRIDMESYQFDAVEGTAFANLLLQRRAQGVMVHVIYDAFGSKHFPDSLIKRMREGGIEVLEFNPLRFSSRVPLDLNRRDHRKLLVVDGAIAITGGVNITRVYLNHPGDTANGPGHMQWRDTDVRIEGPVVAQFETLFAQSWNDQHGPPLPPPPPTPQVARGTARVLAVDGDPDDERPLIYRTLLVAMSLARSSIHLTTGFFVPPPALRHALEGAARRGVQVQVIAPAHSDSLVAIEAGRSHYQDMLEAGVRIYERRGVVLHAKTVVIDGVLSIVGSANLDWRSVLFNDEIDAVIIDDDFGRQMEALFKDDIAASRQIDPKTWRHRSLGERIKEYSSRLAEYLL